MRLGGRFGATWWATQPCLSGRRIASSFSGQACRARGRRGSEAVDCAIHLSSPISITYVVDGVELFGGTFPEDTYRISQDHNGDSESTYGDSENTYGLTGNIVGVFLELYSC